MMIKKNRWLYITLIVSFPILLMTLFFTRSLDTRSKAGDLSTISDELKVGDINSDNKISISDFSIWLEDYRNFKENNNNYSENSDLDSDKKISIEDFGVWLNLWRQYKGREQYPTVTKTSSGFILTANYRGNKMWDYQITGQLPNPCFEGEVVVSSNEPLILFEVIISRLENSDYCFQVIKDFEKNGNFKGDSNIEIEFEVIYK